MSGPFLALLILQSCLILTSSSHKLSLERGKIIPGIHKEPLPQPILYETFIPLILEYQTPKWNKSEVTFNNWYTCLSEKAPYRYSCPVVFHMNQAMLNLHVDFEGLHPVVDSDGPSEMSQQFYESLTTTSEFCNKIQKHFSGIWTQSEDIEFYIKSLENCHWDPATLELPPMIERSIPDYNYSIRTPFTKMENNFYTTFYKDITAVENATNSSTGVGAAANLDLVASALLSNARTTLQGAILGVYYAEKNRWVHANQDCLNQVIPQSIVTQSKFQEMLSKITSSKHFNSTYKLSIDPGSISKYYTLPLTDCSHTSTNTMVVRILIPVLKKLRSKSLELVHIHNLPFQYEDHICQLDLTSGHARESRGFFQNILTSGTHYLYDELRNEAIPTDCKTNELCKISEYGVISERQQDPCMSALLSKNHTGIRTFCNFYCKNRTNVDSRDIPLVTRLHSNTYVLTGTKGNPLTIKYKGQIDDDTIITESEIGSLLVTLPCNSQLRLPNGLVFYGEGPCLSSNITKASAIPIIPYHFGRVKPSDAKSSINTNAASPVSWDGFYYEDVSEDVLVNLADFVDIDRIKGYVEMNQSVVRSYRNKVCTTTTEVSEQLTFEKGSEGSVTSLWAVFSVTTIILLCIQLYILYLLRTFQKTGYAKDDRILYRVPDSPVLY